ncbi:helix-turn-helix transcriptional regulator [Mycolicibacterium monacense]|uniref:Transcriptional regulator n=1 Tax=Mycolicibacterium monacense TaxID=85693 RepID=A0AAD1IZS7_MYCMB|nr:LuxR family transcriptional regulator [Mycolicibacterium monacense]MDA4102509.1 LuxR family transcriptional regulator [Mycolicibacterium monacense DSM 44395]ORB17928.1 LuxR family transcriptional regulator [Mycolicibacterium monacense DSM 44395]QHP88635.1 helix-turn-helix transcriptional regulator [Mycolicibacterium monacense DSM 44395]BBZ63934.1 transcriptional regulator [Mycolicibacterium monacense]
MASQERGRLLYGRAVETAALRRVIAAVRTGRSQVLVLRGEPGAGKTALLGYLLDEAPGWRCVHVAGVESDMELAYAGLHQLCGPLMDYLDDLPPPQRDALTVAFGRGVGPPPERFLVGLAVLSLVAAAVHEQPLLCVVDDAQWLDQVSVQTLGFVARRLMAEPVALVFAARNEGADALTGLPELPVRGLSDADARELLERAMIGGIDPSVRDRVVAETRGNPLALLEVPRSYSSAELAGGFWTVGAMTSRTRIEESFVQRIQVLPDRTRLLLLLAAAEPVGDSSLFLRAAAMLGIAVDALAPAESAGVIEFGPRMRFHHPLMRAAAYRAADLADRRAVHAALAAATDAESDPDRRAWHAANAVAGTDDAVAAELEASASRAQSRGGIAAAAAFMERAAVLTADPELRGNRALAAAQAKRDSAATAKAYELLTIAETAPLSALQRARAARLRAQMAFVRSRVGESGAPAVGDTAPALLDAAKQFEGLDDFASRESYLEAFAALMYAGRLAQPGALLHTAEAARSATVRISELPRAVDLFFRGITDWIIGGIRGGEYLRGALDTMRALASDDPGQLLRWLVPAFPILQEAAAHELWDEDLVDALSAAVAGQAREVGALAGLPQALVYRAGVHVLFGEFNTAATLIAEANSITAATTHNGPVRYHSLLVAAWRGEPAEAMRQIDAAAADGAARGEGRAIGLTGYATAVLYNGLGRYEEAFTAARRACEFEDRGFYSWCLHELVEAAAHLGETDAARRAVSLIEERAGASGTPWGLGALASAQAMLADNDEADRLFTEALDHLGRSRVAVHRARTHLGYGEWLRRMNRRGDARRQLNEAHELFVRMGAQAYAERARKELIAVGEKVRKQRLTSGDELTAQEAQIARLAADGLTNQEIGAQLFISVHTVEWHLRKVFVKMGITSRRQLRTVAWSHQGVTTDH